MRDIVTRQRRHDVAFHASGRIDINRSAAMALGLQRDDVVSVAREDGEYVLYVKAKAGTYAGRYQGRCYPTSTGSHNFRAYSVDICKAVIKACGRITDARLFTGDVVETEDGIGIYLITRNPQ
jgi:hypothetical protein